MVKSVSKVEKKSKMENAYNQIAKQVVKKYYKKRINILFNETLLKKQIEQVGDSYKCIPCQRTFKNKATKINRNNRDHWYCCKYCKNIEQDRLKEIHREKFFRNSYITVANDSEDIKLANDSNCEIDSESKLTV